MQLMIIIYFYFLFYQILETHHLSQLPAIYKQWNVRCTTDLPAYQMELIVLAQKLVTPKTSTRRDAMQCGPTCLEM